MNTLNTLNTLNALVLVLIISLLPTLVQAKGFANSDSYQEVSYDDLLNELSSKKASYKKETPSPLDTVQIHAGLGYVNSFSNFRVNNENMSRYQNGIQISLGIDLFSPDWYSEGIFRNYGITSEGSEEISLKEFDLKVAYKNPINTRWTYHLGTGLANRFLKIKNAKRGISVDDTTPSMMMSGGIYATPSKNISIGFELNARTPFVSSTADKNSYDFALRMTTSM